MNENKNGSGGKNNAVEKAENLSAEKENPVGKKKTTTEPAAVKMSKTGAKETAKGKNARAAKAGDKIRSARKAEKAKRREEKKVRLAEIRKEKKEAKLKAKLAKKQAKLQKKENLRRLAIEKKEERLARKAFLKNESREDRAKRIASEKEAKIAYKRQKAEQKHELKRAKAERRREEKKRKAEIRAEQKRENKKRGVGGWIAAVISLGCSSLVLGSLLALAVFTDYIHVGRSVVNDVSGERAFYDFVSYVDNIETNLSKFLVSSDPEGQQRILSDVIVQSNLADASLAALPVQDESKYFTSKYINQVGDYAKYLNNRLIDGKTLTNDDYEKMVSLYNVNVNLKSALSGLSARIDENYDFTLLGDNNANDILIAQFNDLESQAVDYPEMIYDGAFSDGAEGDEVKGLSGEKVTEKEVKENFRSLFGDRKIGKVEITGKTENGKIDCFNASAMTEDGTEIDANFSIKGGKLVTFSSYRECTEDVFTDEECLANAREFLKKNGFTDMKCVWRYSDAHKTHFNFAYTTDGVIVYPDLVKVNVCKETGIVTGMEASSYYKNHTERVLGKAKHTLGEAAEKVNVKLDVTEENVAVIPAGNGKERLAYEFVGTYNGATYYVYIDANTLKEADIFKVVKTNEGTLLI